MDDDTSSKPAAAAIYCRISQDTEGTGLGVARQRQLCEELARRLGWTVAEVYVDNDLSAYHGAPRPGYDAMCTAVKEGTRDGIVAVDQDRLTRHLHELEGLIDLAENTATPIATSGGDLDLTTADGRLRARIIGTVARAESEKKSERLRRQRDQAAARGVPAGGRRPFGYLPGGMELDPAEADAVREIARRLLDGQPLYQIAQWLNEDGPAPAYSDTWGITSVRSIVASPRAAGLRQHRGRIVGDAAWPPLLDRDTWREVRDLLGDPRRTQSRRTSPRLLTSMLVCGICGVTLHVGSRRRGKAAPTARYLCSSGPGKPGCGRLSITAGTLEEWVGAIVVDLVADLDTAPPEPPAPLVAVDVDQRLATLADLFGRGEISTDEWLAARAPLEARRDAAEQRAARRVPPSVDLEDPAAWWARADVPARRALVDVFIDTITISPATSRRRGIHQERLQVTWRT